jgi:hypothetical protein
MRRLKTVMPVRNVQPLRPFARGTHVFVTGSNDTMRAGGRALTSTSCLTPLTSGSQSPSLPVRGYRFKAKPNELPRNQLALESRATFGHNTVESGPIHRRLALEE